MEIGKGMETFTTSTKENICQRCGEGNPLLVVID